MEGVRRIKIFFNGRQVSKIRVPVSFKDLQVALRKLQHLDYDLIEITDSTESFDITNDENYQESLRRAKGTDLNLNLKKNQISEKNSENFLDLNEKNNSSSERASVIKSPELKSIEKNSRTQEDCTEDKTFGASPGHDLPLIRNPDPVLPSKRRMASTKKISSSSTSTPLKLSKTSESPELLQLSPIQPAQKLSDPKPSKIYPFRSTKRPKIIDPERIRPAGQGNIDVLNSFSCIPAEGELKLIDSGTSESMIITDDSITRSSRLLLTPEGVLITGGSSSPSQAMLVKQNYSISALQPMNHERFWHCMGYLDGCPAVVGGAEKSTVPKVFSSTVEIYRNNTWQQYPSTNYARASASMSWDSQNVYIIGGVTTDGVSNTLVNYIEKWDKDKWIVLNVVIPTSLISCGSLPKGKSEIFIFGGQKSGGLKNNKSFVLNLDDGQVQDEEEFASDSKFTYGQEVKKVGKTLKVCDFKGKVLQLEYKAQNESI